MKKKKIGFTQSFSKGEYTFDFLNRNYLQLCHRLGCTPVVIPNDRSLIKSFLESEKMDAIIFTGGNDVELKPHNKTTRKEMNDRDFCESATLSFAIINKIPVLGLCRGLQFINLYFGGGITMDMKMNGFIDHVRVKHKVTIVDNKFKKIFLKREFAVNSYHNHGVSGKDLAKVLRSFAICEDGSVEGLYHMKHKVTAILWHPERNSSFEKGDLNFIRHVLSLKK